MNRQHSISRIPGNTLHAIVLLLLFAPLAVRAADIDLGLKENPVKFGFSRTMFVDLNESDARSAVKLYSLLLASSSNIVASEQPAIFDTPQAIAAALATSDIDVVSLTTTELLRIQSDLYKTRLITAAVDGSNTEEYLLLVRKDSGIETLADLRQKRLLVYNGLRGSLSPIWLDVLLASNGMEEPKVFFASAATVAKPSRTVLPIFFRQADACVINLKSLKVIGEMNPQVSSQMKIIAASPKFIPTVTCFRSSVPIQSLEKLIRAVTDAQYSVSGRQLLTIFQSDSISETTAEQMQSVHDLLEAQTRLRKKNVPDPAAESKPSTTATQP